MLLQALSSGSQGNAVWVSSARTNVLVDCGILAQDLMQRIRAIGRNPKLVHAIVITHGHLDHIRGLRRFARVCGAPVFLDTELRDRGFLRSLPDIRGFRPDQPFEIGDLEIEAFRVSHDAHPTSGFRIRHGEHRVGLTTDLGCDEGRVTDVLSTCSSVYLEFNYDERMLRDGPYPDPLKQRVASEVGHLSNDQAATILRRAAHPGLRSVVLAHLSQTNNSPELATRAATDALTAAGCDAEIVVARQDEPSRAVEVGV